MTITIEEQTLREVLCAHPGLMYENDPDAPHYDGYLNWGDIICTGCHVLLGNVTQASPDHPKGHLIRDIFVQHQLQMVQDAVK